MTTPCVYRVFVNPDFFSFSCAAFYAIYVCVVINIQVALQLAVNNNNNNNNIR